MGIYRIRFVLNQSILIKIKIQLLINFSFILFILFTSLMCPFPIRCNTASKADLLCNVKLEYIGLSTPSNQHEMVVN